MSFEYDPADQEALERRNARALAAVQAEQANRPTLVGALDAIEAEIRQAPRHPVLAERESTHGDFKDTARTAQSLKYVLHDGKNWSELTMVQQEALDSIAIKIARILSGDFNHPDSWADIEGYARLVREQLS